MSRASRALASSVVVATPITAANVLAQGSMASTSGVAQNFTRTAMAVFNNTDQAILLFLSGDDALIAAGTARPTVRIASGQYWEDPANYQGAVRVSTTSATPGGTVTAPTTGSVVISEWT